MEKLSHIKWYYWLVFTPLFILWMARSIQLISWFFNPPIISSPLLPEYITCFSYVEQAAPFITCFFGGIGIIGFFLKKSYGWAFAFSAALSYIGLFLSFSLDMDTIPVTLYLFALLAFAAVMILLSKPTRQHFSLGYKHYLSAGLFTILVLFFHLDTYNITLFIFPLLP